MNPKSVNGVIILGFIWNVLIFRILTKPYAHFQVCALYDTKEFPALRTAPAQSAMVQLVEREGYTSLISEVFIEETTVDQTLRKVFQAFLRMIEQKHTTVEEMLPLFVAEDFRVEPWKDEHASQVMITFVRQFNVQNIYKLGICGSRVTLK